MSAAFPGRLHSGGDAVSHHLGSNFYNQKDFPYGLSGRKCIFLDLIWIFIYSVF